MIGMKNTTGFTNATRFRCLEDLQKDSLDLCLVYCGWEVCDSGHRYGPNKRTAHVIHVIKSGKGTLEINGKIFHLKKGDAFYLVPNVEAWYEADKKDPWCYYWFGFAGLRVEECLSGSGFSMKNPIRHLASSHIVCEYVEEIIQANQLTYQNELKRNGLLMLIFSHLVGDYRIEQGNSNLPHVYPGSFYVKHAIEYISYHYNEKIKINELADYIGVNRSYLTSSFKKAIGCSPQEFLVNLRMEKARSLLKKTEISICQVAAQVGYTDQLAFSKIFKQNVGISPKTYRESEDELLVLDNKGDYQRKQPL